MSNYNIPELPLGYELETKAVLKQVNHGIQEVRRLLAENGNKEAEFEINLLTVFLVKIRDANVIVADSIRNELFNKIDATIMQPSCNHLPMKRQKLYRIKSSH